MSNSNSRKFISLKEAVSKIPNKKALYDALIMRGYLLPDYETTMVTTDFLAAVKAGKCYCPHKDEKVYQPCAHPPLMQTIKDEILKLTPEKTAGKMRLKVDQLNFFMMNKRPGVDFLLLMLAKLNPDHSFFDINYRPPKNPSSPAFMMKVANDDKFFEGININYDAKRSNSRLFVSREEKLAHKLEQLKSRQKSLAFNMQRT